MADGFTAEDEQQLTNHGIAVAEARRQLDILRKETKFVKLDRPCTIGDGIVEIPPARQEQLLNIHHEAASNGRWTKFTPASGAASRMFDLNEEQQQLFCERLAEFAYAKELIAVGEQQGIDIPAAAQQGDYATICRVLLEEDGLNFQNLAKGLLTFHQGGMTVRTAFEEHLHEAVACFADAENQCRAHFTVGDEHAEAFESLLQQVQAQSPETKWAVSFSVQEPRTDTIGVETGKKAEQNQPLRNNAGSLVLRPGGHGALIENLDALEGDCVFVKNIDNVQHFDRTNESQKWIAMVCGYLVDMQQRIHEAMRLLEINPDDETANQLEELTREYFPHASIAAHTDSVTKIAALRNFHRRPLRVCGMVVNEGQPGGGPFWVRHDDGSQSVQIVESVEIADEEDQQKIVGQATHFNPVFMALGLRDHRGEVYDLEEFVDSTRTIVTEKLVNEKRATVMERPGLWNGAMAKWNTIFVNVPIAVFSPAKYVVDLLNEAHQPIGS